MSGFNSAIDDYPILADDFPISDYGMDRLRAFRWADRKVAILALSVGVASIAANRWADSPDLHLDVIFVVALVFLGGKFMQIDRRLAWLDQKTLDSDLERQRHHRIMASTQTKLDKTVSQMEAD